MSVLSKATPVREVCPQFISSFCDRNSSRRNRSHCKSISVNCPSVFKNCDDGTYLGSTKLRWRKRGQTENISRGITARAASGFQSPKPCLDPDVRKSVLAIVLGGGAGTRLYPITKTRAKPAVPLGANYRLIDIPVSNCINSDILKIYVLTQYNSTSLNRHLALSYPGNIGGIREEGFVEVLAAQQSRESPNWFQGTADAVRQYLWLFDEHPVQEFLILAGDHLYKMNYQKFIQTHRDTNADITIATVSVDEEQAQSLGILKIDRKGHIVEFSEKPKGEALENMRVDTSFSETPKEGDKSLKFLASMGIYVINKEVMQRLLCKNFPHANDFGHEIIPSAVAIGLKVQAHLFDGYWEDVGTVKAFYNANLRLAKNPTSAFSLYDWSFPIYTQKRSLPPSIMLATDITESVVGESCFLKGCKIHHSVIGLCSRVEDGAIIEDSLLFGADYYESNVERSIVVANGGIPIGVGKNSHIKKAIIDKNARIGENVKIINADKVEEAERESEGYCIKSGIVIVIKGAVIPNNTII